MAILTHIKRRSIYKQIKDEALLIGQHAVPYSFRHRYSKESHYILLQILLPMGHSVEVHLDNILDLHLMEQ